MNAVMRMPTEKSLATHSIELIEPNKALEYLKRNAGNRPLKDAVVRRLIKAIKSGHWQLTHQGIAFDEDGALIDGQHRLSAIARAGVPVRMVVFRGVPRRAFTVIDSNAPRSASDHIALRGYKSPVSLAACLRLQWQYEKMEGDMARKLTPEFYPDRDDIEDLALNHERLVDIHQGIASNHKNRIMPPAWLSFLMYQFERKDPALCDYFIARLVSGANLGEASIILKTRNRLAAIADEERNSARHHKNALVMKAAIVIKAWNAVRSGQEFSDKRLISWRSTEQFPQIS